MRKIAFALAILGSTLLPTLYTAPAHAQASRTWVSGVGDDANPCSRTAPCKTFAGAISKTAALGEIDCLDPGGFGALTITKSITIDCRYTSNGGVVVSGTNAFVVAAGPTDKITLIGLDFEGLGSGLNGVNVISGLEVIISDCLIRNFTQNGVNVASSTNNAQVIVQNSLIHSNGVAGTANTGGVNVNAPVGANNTAFIINTLLENNQNYSVQVTGASSQIFLLRSTLHGPGMSLVNGGVVDSFGPSNVIGGNTNPTNTINYK